MRTLLFDQLLRDLRIAARALRRTPAFSIAVASLLGVGIGLGTALFTLVYSMVARPLPIREATGVVNVYQRFSGRYSREVNGSGSLLSYAEFKEYATASAFISSAVYHEQELTVGRVTNGPVPSQLVSCDYFGALGAHMALGRGLIEQECDRAGQGAVAVLGYGLWQSQFGADSSLIGRTIDVNGLPLTVVGVAEPRFHGIALEPTSLWVPLTMQPSLEHGRDSTLLHPNASWLVMTARLSPGTSAGQAHAQLALMAARRDRLYPGRTTTVLVRSGALLNFPEAIEAAGVPLALTLVLGFAVLAMACVNATGLTLSRGLARHRELAIRLALGASREQLVRHLLTETVLLAFGGVAVGLALSAAVPRALGAVSVVAEIQLDASPDMRIVAFALALGVGALLMVGLVPALHATRTDPSQTFKGDLGADSRLVRPFRLQAIVAGAQVAGSVLLLLTASLFLRASLRASSISPGYKTTGIVAFSLNAASLGMGDERIGEVYHDLTARLSRVPGVDGVALAAQLPLLHTTTLTITPDESAGDEKHSVEVIVASPSYFATMGIGIMRGAALDSIVTGDTREAVVSASVAAALWPNQNPLGRRFKAGGWYRIVGVAGETNQSSMSATTPSIYIAPTSPRDMQIVLRTRGSEAEVLRDLPRWARQIDPALVVHSERLEDRIAAATRSVRVVSAATSALGALSLLLASIGLWGIVTYGVAQRRRELAIRMAVGARGGQVVALMMRRTTRLAAWGLAAGLLLGALFAEVARSFLLGLNPLDPVAYVAVSGAMLFTIAGATLLPALSAARLDPSLLLRANT